MVDKPVLVDVIFTAGKVFENLRCKRQSTHAFITTGGLRGITSRADLELLSDLSDATEPSSHSLILALPSPRSHHRYQ